MLTKEKKYEFRKRLLKVHKENVRDDSLLPDSMELELKDTFFVCVPENASEVAMTAAKDFVDYLFVSMNVSAVVKKAESAGNNSVSYQIEKNMEQGYTIVVEDDIKIICDSERSFAQALYFMEDKMNWRRAPFLKKGKTYHKILFSPRMVHSGYALDDFPNEHLAAIAHAGRDAILVYTKGVNLTPSGFQDFNSLIYRAKRYGIDVYAYSNLVSHKHPDDADAVIFYDGLYGELFKNCPELKGVVLVGESVEFPSKDPHVSGTFYYNNEKDGLPTGKPSAGWWPCEDYPAWLERVKSAITKYKADADIVFWTYNWGYAPEKDRIRLINALPEGISLNVTYEMFEHIKCYDSIIKCEDYTLAFEGPGKYFISEAIAAKKRGIRLYSMTNTGGMTWDMGVIPYEPMPYQWMKRYCGILEANKKWELCGLMESHHYGFYPSFIGDLSKWALIEDGVSMSEKCKMILEKYYGAENYEMVSNALKLWSEAIANHLPTDSDQYGAFRIGPAYPFCLIKTMNPVSIAYAKYGNRIVSSTYPESVKEDVTLPFIRIKDELRAQDKMIKLMEAGMECLRSIPEKQQNTELQYLINLGEYMCCYAHTGRNARKWYYLVSKMKYAEDREDARKWLRAIEVLAEEEMENAKRAIVFAERDSRLGWEPSMEYLGDAEHIEWKIRQMQYMLDKELMVYKKALCI